MRKLTAFGLSVALLVLSLGASCDGQKKTAKHKLAIYTADADAALIAVTDSVAVLQARGRMQPAAAKSVYQINLRMAVAVDIIRERSKTGFDKKDLLPTIKQVIEDIRAAEAAGVVNLSDKARTQFLQITFFAMFTAQSIQAIIEATKPPEVPPEMMAAAQAAQGVAPRRAQQAGEDTLWTDIVLIAQTAILQGIQHSRLDEAGAFAAGEKLSSDLKASLNAKIAAIP